MENSQQNCIFINIKDLHVFFISYLLGFDSPADSALFFSFELQYGFYARISGSPALPRKGSFAVMNKGNYEA